MRTRAYKVDVAFATTLGARVRKRTLCSIRKFCSSRKESCIPAHLPFRGYNRFGNFVETAVTIVLLHERVSETYNKGLLAQNQIKPLRKI